MIELETVSYTYGVYVVRSIQGKWLESFIIGHNGADVLMESNVLIKKDQQMRAVSPGAEHYGCFETLQSDPYQLRLIRTLTEAEKNEWNDWHRLYRELKWKVKSILSYQSNSSQECQEDFYQLQVKAQHLIQTYPISKEEKTALFSLLDDIECLLIDLNIDLPNTPFTKEKQEESLLAVHEQPLIIENNESAVTPDELSTLEKSAITLDELSTLKESAITLDELNILETSANTTQDSSNLLPFEESTIAIEKGEMTMKPENILVQPVIQPKFNNSVPTVNPVNALYEDKEITEYFRRLTHLSEAVIPFENSTDPAIQKVIVQLCIEIAWLKAKILRSLGFHAVHSENEIGEMQYIEVQEGIYADKFQAIAVNSLFDSFSKTNKEGTSSFEANKNTMIRTLWELLRYVPIVVSEES